MDMPQPTALHERLHTLAGRWSGEEQLHPSPWDPKGGTAEGHVDNHSGLDGFALIQDYVQVRDGATTYRGHAVFSVDTGANEVVLHWFDNMGSPPNVFRGNYAGDTLVLSFAGPQGQQRVSFRQDTPGHYDFRMEVSGDGANWQTFMTGSYQRQPG